MTIDVLTVRLAFPIRTQFKHKIKLSSLLPPFIRPKCLTWLSSKPILFLHLVVKTIKSFWKFRALAFNSAARYT